MRHAINAVFRRRILNRTARIIGQGYVGVSLACVAAEAGFNVTGVDALDARRVAELAEGRMVVAGVNQGLARSAYATGRLTFSSSVEAVSEGHLVFVCVPDAIARRDARPPVRRERRQGRRGRGCDPGSLVVLESSTYPGTTEDLVRPMLETVGAARRGGTSCSRTRPSGSIPGTRSSSCARRAPAGGRA